MLKGLLRGNLFPIGLKLYTDFLLLFGTILGSATKKILKKNSPSVNMTHPNAPYDVKKSNSYFF